MKISSGIFEFGFCMIELPKKEAGDGSPQSATGRFGRAGTHETLLPVGSWNWDGDSLPMPNAHLTASASAAGEFVDLAP